MPMVVDGMGHIGRHRDCTGAHDRQIGDHPFRPVLADQPNPLAARDPEGSQAECEPANVARRGRPSDRLVGSSALGPQKRSVGEPRRLLEKHRRQAAAAVVIHSSPAFPQLFLRVSPGLRNTRTPPYRGASLLLEFATSTTVICRRELGLLHLQKIYSEISPNSCAPSGAADAVGAVRSSCATTA